MCNKFINTAPTIQQVAKALADAKVQNKKLLMTLFDSNGYQIGQYEIYSIEQSGDFKTNKGIISPSCIVTTLDKCNGRMTLVF